MANTTPATTAALASGGVLDLIAESGPMAKLVLLILLASSVFSWAIILMKWRALSRASSQNQKFLNVFWHSKSIDEIFAKSEKFPSSPVATVFKNGVKELKKAGPGGEAAETDPVGRVENIQRALLRSSSSEIAALETHLGWLATTASAAPFVGLFGTVWGIMNSFQSIGATGSANLAAVGPGISEALIATATGIAVAIPAVVAYNHFAGLIKRQAVDMDCFSHDFINIIQRSLSGGAKRGS
jgi:biopolymer transport protein TolQ